jgi:hypothetical protein
MAENYAAALKGVLSSLQSNCRSEDTEKTGKCRRAMEERLVMNEVALSTDRSTQDWKTSELRSLRACFDECQISGRTKVRECNSTCSNHLLQGLWKRINLTEYEQIASKYA